MFLKLVLFVLMIIILYFIRKNEIIKNNGEKCYGKIIDISECGVNIGESPELKANILVYIPSEHQIKYFVENIGYNPNKEYKINDYIEIKLLNNRITIKSIIKDISDLPEDVRNEFENNEDEEKTSLINKRRLSLCYI